MKLATVLLGFVVRTLTLFCFASAVLGGQTRRAAWLGVAGDALSLSSGYRLWRRLGAAQSALRARLAREVPAPTSSASEPLSQLLSHLSLVSGACASASGLDLFAGYQLCFERGLFDR